MKKKNDKKQPSKHESRLVQRYAAVADAMALLFSGYVEVIIHDLESQEVVYIANNISKRKLGDASALEEIKFNPSEAMIGPYEKLNWDGQKVRSMSVVLHDDENEPIGLLCINLLISSFEAAKNMLELFLDGNKVIPQPKILFHDDWQERINTFINDWLSKERLSIPVLTHANKRELVKLLYVEGAFKGKSSADYIANVLNMGRATVFKYLSEVKKLEQEDS